MIYEHIKHLCEERNISIYKLEKELNFSNGTISKWQQSVPTVDKLQRVAIFFRLPLEYFLNKDKK